MNTHGIVYVATLQDHFVEEAFLSAESAKRQAPALPTTLFTDRSENALCRTGVFNTVIRIENSDLADARANAQINRLACLQRTPYERTLYLDTDARVLTPAIADLFKTLDDCDMAFVEDALDTSNARTWSGLRMFNCGVILFKKSAPTTAVLQQWETHTRRNLALAQQSPLPVIPELAHVSDEAVRRALLEIDKLALRSVLPPDAPHSLARVMTLDQSWNYRKAPENQVVNILHLHDRVGEPSAEIKALADAWAKKDRLSEARHLRDYLAAL